MTTPIGTIGTIGREVCPAAGRLALTITETPWTIEGDPDAVWVWTDGTDQGGPVCSTDPTWTPTCITETDANPTIASRARMARPEPLTPAVWVWGEARPAGKRLADLVRTPTLKLNSRIHNSEHDPL